MARLKVTQLCERCGKRFHPWPKRKDQERRLYCSPACREIPAVERFWTQVKKTAQCWEWTGRVDRDGYGEFYPVQAHRFSWQLHNGSIPDGMCVLHRCDNPPCTNPDHLFLGTVTDNNNDRIAKGRSLRGNNHGMAKLADRQIREIRRRYREGGITQQRLGDEYGVDQTNISLIIRRHSWKGLH